MRHKNYQSASSRMTAVYFAFHQPPTPGDTGFLPTNDIRNLISLRASQLDMTCIIVYDKQAGVGVLH